MMNKEMFEFPIIYANTGRMGKIATGWGAHTTVGVEATALGLKKVLITTTGLKGPQGEERPFETTIVDFASARFKRFQVPAGRVRIRS